MIQDGTPNGIWGSRCTYTHAHTHVVFVIQYVQTHQSFNRTNNGQYSLVSCSLAELHKEFCYDLTSVHVSTMDSVISNFKGKSCDDSMLTIVTYGKMTYYYVHLMPWNQASHMMLMMMCTSDCNESTDSKFQYQYILTAIQ